MNAQGRSDYRVLKKREPMTEAQCDQLLSMLQKDKWPYRCRRLNIVPPEFRGRGSGEKRRSLRLSEEDQEPVVWVGQLDQPADI